MTIVGQKKIFAIEWNISGTDEHTGWVLGNISFFANDQHIEGEGGILSSDVYWVKKYLKGYHLESYDAFYDFPIDFSDVPKDDVFYSIYSSMYGSGFTVCPEQYREFYTRCKKLMIEDYHAKKLNKLCFTEEKMNESIALGDDYSEDFLLGNWIHAKFEIDQLAAEIFSPYKIYLIRDIAKQRERLIWKRHAKYDKEKDTYHEFPVYEAILPIGYFKSVVKNFVEVASKEIEKAKVGT